MDGSRYKGDVNLNKRIRKKLEQRNWFYSYAKYKSNKQIHRLRVNGKIMIVGAVGTALDFRRLICQKLKNI